MALSQTVEWALPLTSVAPNSPTCLEIFPVSVNGVDYGNTKATAAAPPKLIVTYQ